MCNVSVRRFLTILGQGRYAKRMVQRYCYKETWKFRRNMQSCTERMVVAMLQRWHSTLYCSLHLWKTTATVEYPLLHICTNCSRQDLLSFIWSSFFVFHKYSNKLQIKQQFHFLYDTKIVRPISRLQIGYLGMYCVELQKVFFIKVE